jgi:hypothetical protein
MVILTPIENESLQVFFFNFATKVARTHRQKDDVLMWWLPRSPDLTPCDFFFWEFVKDFVFVPSLPANLRDLRNCITAAVALVNRDMLTEVWDEMDYCIDFCRISRGGYI